MAIASYLAYCQPGAKESLRRDLVQRPGCEVLASDNEDVLVLVTETAGRGELDTFEDSVSRSPHIRLLAMVAGFDAEEID